MIYGYYPTGGLFPYGFELNINEVKKLDNNYKILIDIYTYDENNDEEVDRVINSDFSEFEDEIKYQFDIEITMHEDETYTINSFKLINKK